MLKKEWQSLLKNKILLLAMVAIIAVPIIYSGLFLGSMWDPYGNVDSLPVAVVNLDKASKYQDSTLEIGNNLVDNLKENQSLDFHFVSEAEAEKGLADGTYYMTITIPENFSENAATVLDDNPKKMELNYETNPGTNYIASKMSETALTKIKDAVAEEVTKTYTETMFDQIITAGEGMQEAADGAGTLESGMSQLADGNTTISENLQVLADSTLTLKSGADTMNIGLSQYVNGVSSVASGAAQLNSGVSEYTTGVNQAARGAATLNNNSGALNEGVNKVSAGVSQVSGGSAELTAGLQTMSDTINGQLSQVSQGTIDSLTGGLEQYRSGIHQLYSAMSGLTVPSTGDIEAEGAALGSNLAEAGSQLTFAGGNLGEAGGNLGAATAALQGIGDLTPEQQEAVNTALGYISAADTNITNADGNIADAGTAVGGASSNGTAIGGVLTNLSGAADALSNGISTVAEMDSNADTVLGGSSQAITSLYSGIQGVNTALTEQLIPGAQTLQGGIGQVQYGVDNDLKNGVNSYTGGVSELKSGLDTITNNSGALQSGASQLYEGASQLTANSDALLSGSNQISGGAQQLSDGAGQLAAGSETLGEGIFDAQKGTRTLKSGLTDGAKKVNDLSADTDTYDMFAAPVEANGTQATYVENNGHAMAPYMMSVALWVGCIAFCIMYPLSKYEGELKSGFSWWASKASISYLLAILMAVVMIGLLHVCDGFSPAEMGKTLAFACLTSVAFMSIVYFFEVCFGKVGSFLMLVFMVVQLSGSAGTYPVEISAGFVAKIHRWLPFTYTVNAFRSTISGGESIRTSVIVLAAIAIVFTVLTILLFMKRAKNIQENKKGLNDFLEEKGLA